LKIAFFGSSKVSVPYLEWAIECGLDLACVVTKEPKRRSRRGALEANPVESAAAKASLPICYDPKQACQFDLGIVVAYGKLLPKAMVEESVFVNVHYSILPLLRGAAPMERAILSGMEESGVSIMRIVPEMDAGPVLATMVVKIKEMTISEVNERLTFAGVNLLAAILGDLSDPDLLPRGLEQVGRPTYAPKLTAEDMRLRTWESVEMAKRRIRLERAFLFIDGVRLRILGGDVAGYPGRDVVPGSIVRADGRYGVAFADGVLMPDRVVPEGRKEMRFEDFIRGLRSVPDQVTAYQDGGKQ
jgi:methionyl-tRNA formyltransferase